MTRVRIFSLDDLAAIDLPRARERSTAEAEPEAAPVVPRKREETARRHHAFLDQTVPPSNPLVLESERRRSGREPQP